MSYKFNSLSKNVFCLTKSLIKTIKNCIVVIKSKITYVKSSFIIFLRKFMNTSSFFASLRFEMNLNLLSYSYSLMYSCFLKGCNLFSLFFLNVKSLSVFT